MATANSDTINELITKHLAGEATPAEESRLLTWINQDEANKAHFNALKKTFELATNHVATPASDDVNVDVDDEWEHFQQKVGAATNVRTVSTPRLWMRVAASLLILLVAGGIIFYYSRTNTTTFQTAEKTETVTLPDGSRVTLNQNSFLSYDDSFGKEHRALTLQGEAFFDVTPDPRKPFIILAATARVQVVGTTFNVNAYDSLGSVKVVVETGIVSLAPVKGGFKPVDLLPGEVGTISKSDHKISVAVNDDMNFRAWDTRHIIFVNDDLKWVISTLEKVYQAEISIKTDIPPSCIVTVTFDRQSLESVMRVLENTLNLKYTISGKKVEIIEAGC